MEKETEAWGVKMRSDCMEPSIPKGAIAIVDRTLEVRDGDIAFVRLSDGRSYLRRCHDVGGRYRLVAEKPGEDSPEVVEVVPKRAFAPLFGESDGDHHYVVDGDDDGGGGGGDVDGGAVSGGHPPHRNRG